MGELRQPGASRDKMAPGNLHPPAVWVLVFFALSVALLPMRATAKSAVVASPPPPQGRAAIMSAAEELLPLLRSSRTGSSTGGSSRHRSSRRGPRRLQIGLCLPGQYDDDGDASTGCVECKAGRFAASAGATSCDACPAGTTSAPSSSECAYTPLTHNSSIGDGLEPLLHTVNFVASTEGAAVERRDASEFAVAADLNGDDVMDLFVANANAANELLIGDWFLGFTAVTEGAAVERSDNSRGAVAADLNGDGVMDLFVVNQGEANELLIGDGSGGFTAVTEGAAVERSDHSQGVVAADLNGDDVMDLFVANANEANELLIGDGSGGFTAVTKGAAVERSDVSNGAVAADLNGDGVMDLFVLNGGPGNAEQRNELLIGNGSGGFTAVTEGAAVEQVPHTSLGVASYGAVATDLTGDGMIDLFVANSPGPCQFLIGDGSGGFTAVTEGAAVEHSDYSVGVVAADLNDDGMMDLFVTVFGDPFRGGGHANYLLIGDGSGGFTAVTEGAAVEHSDQSQDVVAADLNGDGVMDLFVVNENRENELLVVDKCPLDGHAAQQVWWLYQPHHACDVVDTHGSYTTRAHAEAACMSDPYCTGTLNSACDNEGPWTTCTSSPQTWPSVTTAEGCAYAKQRSRSCCESATLDRTIDSLSHIMLFTWSDPLLGDCVGDCADPCPSYATGPADEAAALRQLCELCPAGMAVHGGGGEDFLGTVGVPSTRRDYACSSCESGKYRALTQLADCVACPVGRYSEDGASECSICSANLRTNVNTSGATHCLSCDAGSGPNADQTDCEACSIGEYSAFGVCQPCTEPNTVSADGTACVSPFNCGPGTSCIDTDGRWDPSHCSVSADCTSCSTGSFGTGTAACVACTDPGKVANAAQTACESCGAGTAPSADRSVCESCQGTDVSTFGILCEECASPYVINEQHSTCSACSAGSGPNANQTDCEACSIGEYSVFGVCQDCIEPNTVSRDRTSCNVPFHCPDGTQCPLEAAPCTTETDCTTCLPGHVSASGEACVLCDGNGQRANEEQIACVPCPPGAMPSNNRVSCISCGEGNYSQFGVECASCPDMAIATDDRTGCMPCPLARSRDRSHYAADDRCPGTALNAGAPCRAGYVGTLCQSCALQFHLSHTGSCEQCDTTSAAQVWAALGGLVCATLALVWVCWVRVCKRSRIAATTLGSETLIEINPFGSMETESSQLDQWSTDGFITSASVPWRNRIRCPSGGHLRLAVRCAFQPFRIIITYMQVTSQLGNVLHIRYPDGFSEMMHAIKSSLDVFSMVFSPECEGLSSFQNNWLLRIVGVPCLLSLISLAHGAYLLTQRHSEPDAMGTVRKELKSDLFFIVFFIYPMVCNTCFNVFNCVSLDDATSSELHTRSVLSEDDRMFCDEIGSIWSALSAGIIVVFGLGVPVLFGGVLMLKARQHEAEADDNSAKLAARVATDLSLDTDAVTYLLRDVKLGSDFGFLMDAYQPRYLFWESLDILRKLALVGMILLVGQGSVEQIMCAAGLTVIFMMMQVNYRPYKIVEDNDFRIATELHLFLVIQIAFALRSSDSVTGAGRTNDTFFDWMLGISFVLCIPMGFLLTVISKMKSTSAIMAGNGPRAAFSRLQLGLATAQDREQVAVYCDRLCIEIEATEANQNRVQWMQIGADEQFQCIDTVASEEIEAAFASGESRCAVSIGGVLHAIDFHPMTATHANNKQSSALRRRVLAASLPDRPMDWSAMPSGHNFLQIAIDRSGTPADVALWKRVERRVSASLPQFCVESIGRLQNVQLLQKYEQFCWQLDVKEQGSVNERELFHYAPEALVSLITESGSVGFDPRLGRGEYGSGTYFAEHAVYSAALAHDWLFSGIDPASFGAGGKWGGDGNDLPLEGAEQIALRAEMDAPPTLTLLWGRVALGHCKDFGARCASGRGNAAADAAGIGRNLPDWPRLGDGQGMNRPPPRPEGGGHELYDSVTGTEGDLKWTQHPRLRQRGAEFGRQYVTFHPDQSYPDAIVQLRRR